MDFIIADVKTPILKTDFLQHYNLLVGLRYVHRLVDGITQLCIQGISTHTPPPSPLLLPKQPKTESDTILSTYPDIVRPCDTEAPIKHSVTHHIKMVCHLSHVYPCRLSPENLKAACPEFEHNMLQKGIIHP